MSLRDEITSIVAEPVIHRIHFSLGGLMITGAGFGRVRQAIVGNRINIVPVASMPAEAGGRYNGTRNEIGVSPSLTQAALASSIQMRALFAHECTHALVDLNRAARTTVLTDEAAAYVVQLMYRLGRGQSWLRSWSQRNQTSPTGRIFHEAVRIIDQHHLLRHRAFLQRSQFQALREAVQRHPVYRGTSNTELTTADGIA